MLFGKKHKCAQLLSFITGFSAFDLPPPLCHYEAISIDDAGMAAGLAALAERLAAMQ
jgi:hypothetical protein